MAVKNRAACGCELPEPFQSLRPSTNVSASVEL